MKKYLIGLTSLLMLATLMPSYAHSSMEPHDWDGKSKPSIELKVVKDEMSGFNVQIKTKGFKWAPQNASKAHRAGEGHAHIYVDGVKIGRVYGSWYHLATANLNLSNGTHIVKVDLNGNDHAPYMYKGKLLAATATIKTP